MTPAVSVSDTIVTENLTAVCGLPFVAYGLAILGASLMLHEAQRGLIFIAVGMLLLAESVSG